ALIGVDGKTPRAYRVGSVVDGDLVLQSVSLRSAAIGPASGAPAVVLEVPPLPVPGAGTLPPPAPMTPPVSGPVPPVAGPPTPVAVPPTPVAPVSPNTMPVMPGARVPLPQQQAPARG